MGRKKFPRKEFTWTPKLAYAVGLIVTDGHLSSDGRHIVMRSSDKDLLQTYKKCLGIQHCKIGKTAKSGYSARPSYRVQHGDVQFYRWLQEIGIPQDKTHSIGILNIPDEVFPDFLRGHLDGDGSITTYIDHYNTYKNPKYVYKRLWVRFLSASGLHITWLQQKIVHVIGVTGHTHERKPKDKRRVSMHLLKFGKKESTILLKRLYYNECVPCLRRKREIAKEYLD